MGKYINEPQRMINPIRVIPDPLEKRLVKRLGLEYAYDHANPTMDAYIMIFKVVERYRFNDMLQVAYYFGIDLLKQVALDVYGDDQPRRLKQVIRNIENGFKDAEVQLSKTSPSHFRCPN